MAGVQAFVSTILFLSLITFSTFHPTHSKPNGFSLRLIPRDSPESPLYPGNLTVHERIERLVRFSKARARYVELTSGSNSTADLNQIELTLLRDNFFYIVQIALGTPKVPQLLLLDTGGGLIWTQCQPCVACYPQQGNPIFDSTTSSTYRKLPCDHPLCSGANPLYQCVNNECVYNIGYGGGATTRGVASFETFTFPTDIAENVIFGCSKENRNIQFSKSGYISGVMGLSLSPDSLVTQLADKTKKTFSYCLLPFTDALINPGFVKFGDEIPLPAGNVYTSPFVTPPGQHYYHLNLLDISVGLKRLGFPPGTFTIGQGGTGGFFIDSGALIPQLNTDASGRNAYREVMRAFQQWYDGLKLTRIGKVPEGLALCYKYTPDFNQFATLTYHLQDANYVVDGKYAHVFNKDAGYFCVAMMPGNGKSMLGAWHQQNMRVTYNGNINSLQFSVETCPS
ncbi:hypothetical protein ACFX15_007143 [Malus domestica]